MTSKKKTAPIVRARCGPVVGVTRRGHDAFFAIPFAEPPVGARRFLPPVPVRPWQEPRAANALGPAPPQPDFGDLFAMPGQQLVGQSEDCLHLNVHVPGNPEGKGRDRPVLVWLYGGAFVVGANCQPLYDPARLVERGDAIVVAPNYRLGPFGNLDLEALGANEANGASGESIAHEGETHLSGLNLMLQDQIAALKWVRDNIASFGGNPDCATLFGESAGATGVLALMAAPAAKGLFCRAISQSVGGPDLLTESQRALAAETLAKALGMSSPTLNALQAVKPEQLLQAAAHTSMKLFGHVRFPFGPTVDGHVLPQHPLDAIANGSAQGVDFMCGTNRDELRLFERVYQQSRGLDHSQLIQLVASFLANTDDPERKAQHLERKAQLLIERYKQARAGKLPINPTDLYCAIGSDRLYRNGTLAAAEGQLPHARNVYVYMFNFESPDPQLAACHTLELPFVFDQTRLEGAERFCGRGPEVDALAARMRDAWLAFAKTGNPAHSGLPQWPAYNLQTRPTLLFDRQCSVALDPLSEERKAWLDL